MRLALSADMAGLVPVRAYRSISCVSLVLTSELPAQAASARQAHAVYPQRAIPRRRSPGPCLFRERPTAPRDHRSHIVSPGRQERISTLEYAVQPTIRVEDHTDRSRGFAAHAARNHARQRDEAVRHEDRGRFRQERRIPSCDRGSRRRHGHQEDSALARQVLRASPSPKGVEIVAMDGCSAVLWDLRPYKVRLDDVSPELIRAIRADGERT